MSAVIPDPVLDGERLAVLRSLDGARARRGPALDRIARLAARLVAADLAFVTFVEADLQAFSGACGLEGPVAETRSTPLSSSFCQYVVAQREPLVVADATVDPLLRGNGAVEDLGVVGYAGVPLRHAGHVVGALCAITRAPRDWTDEDLSGLADLALAAEAELDLHRLGEAHAALRAAIDRALHEDPATGLRDAERLAADLAVEGADRVVVELELDGVDAYAERFGAAAADRLVATRAAILAASVRPYGTAYVAGPRAFRLALDPAVADAALAAARSALGAQGPGWAVRGQTRSRPR
jgi:GAF domain-containing protein